MARQNGLTFTLIFKDVTEFLFKFLIQYNIMYDAAGIKNKQKIKINLR
jgi:hypothetical protein